MKQAILSTFLTACAISTSAYASGTETPDSNAHETTNSYIEERLLHERDSDENPFSMTAHKMNYILPYTYARNINRAVYSEIDKDGLAENFKHEEAKFQLSLKYPVLQNMFYEGDHLYFGLTLKSFWQIYSEETSRPFRNTDYNPEFFYITEVPELNSLSNHIAFGVEHESNGETQYLSRSWNRIYAQWFMNCSDYALSLKVWHRISEEAKEDPLDPSGDDNPDILDYYGNAELSAIYRHDDINYSMIGRHNFSTGKGYLELGMTFPIVDNLRGYIQYVNGYGESLIDYNRFQQRVGVGVVFSDIL